ncbi:hypothetical protein [Robiginitalea marina]|uniref:Fibronectin type-III domain-containing protein n=1 Tax=Robiginitalea marina TaxID=2954105 RepID=A0ABT1B0Z7_9FLAO|nr:hypothetical protein [Robiginitalea marina]MCO5725931.1 hypothetical protein [Robiginitalea marina]
MKGTAHITRSLALAALALSTACGGGDSGGNPEPEPQPLPEPRPTAATLVFPENDSECTEGAIVNDNQSRVTFQWNASQDTDSYQVNLRNLNTGSTALATSNTNAVDITLLRGVPYEWFVVSRANGTTETASSAVWQFYNAGPGITNYAPFPAQAIAPTRGSTVTASPVIRLEWSGSDVDDDIASYTVYFGAQDPPPSLAEGLTTTSFETALAGAGTYFWQVETLDEAGNRTQSELFVFRVE